MFIMAIQIGKILSVSAFGDLVVQLSNQTMQPISAELAARLGLEKLAVGDRLRLDIEAGSVRRVTKLSMAIAAPVEIAPQRIDTRITQVSREQQNIFIESEHARGEFGPLTLSDAQWSKLEIGMLVTLLKYPDGRYRLELPEAVLRQDTHDIRVISDGANLHYELAVVSAIGAYRTKFDAKDGKQYDALNSQFSGVLFGVNDTVLLTIERDTDEVLALEVQTRWLEGIGGFLPCEHLDEWLQTERDGIEELVKTYCADGRLEWYWRKPGKPEKLVSMDGKLPERVIAAFRRADPNFTNLFAHQARSLEALRQRKKNVMVLTPTASGKTNCYNPAVFAALCDDPAACALYVFPLNALLNDQAGTLQKLVDAFAIDGTTIRVGRLIGGMTATERDAIAVDPPQIIVTNPEMLSWLLQNQAYKHLASFLGRLRFIVLDEAHAYRSVLGLHMAGLLRQLVVSCQRQGNLDAQYVLSSATVGKPEDLATRLTSMPLASFEIIREHDSGASSPQRHWLMLAPKTEEISDALNSTLHQAAMALVEVMVLRSESLKSILFVRSFRELRLVYQTVENLLEKLGRSDLKNKIGRYASGLMSIQQREEVYRRLKGKDKEYRDLPLDQQLSAVIATNALEAGIDIGDLDVCILAGFPMHVMRIRQMAGRAGRKKEGVVIYIPDPTRALDNMYARQPELLLTKEAEKFVIDHENVYIARRHIVALASSLNGGVKSSELEIFGRHKDEMVQMALQESVLESVGDRYTAGRRAKRKGQPDKWAIGSLRSVDEDMYAICKALPKDRQCVEQGCLIQAVQANSEDGRCPKIVQLIDRQYVYREAHPDAIFESSDGEFYKIVDFDDQNKMVWVEPLPDTTLERTFPLESFDVELLKEIQAKTLPNGAVLHFGDVRVTRSYSGYGEYQLVPRTRCRKCRTVYSKAVDTCPVCKIQTRLFLDHTKPELFGYPEPYQNHIYTITLETVATWLTLPAALESQLSSVAPCPIQGPHNKVAEFLTFSPTFRDAQGLQSAKGLSTNTANTAYANYRHWRPALQPTADQRNQTPIFPATYGQCLCSDLRKQHNEQDALSAFERVTGYHATRDEKHICRRCFTGILLPAAHTLEHIVAKNYPVVALGDSQDIGSVTFVIHPQTRCTTTVWFDNYEGGLGASQKIFEQFESLIIKADESLSCLQCHADSGCPECIQMAKCDRHNVALSKYAGIGLAYMLLGQPEHIPDQVIWLDDKRAQEFHRRASQTEHADRKVPRPGQVNDSVAAIDPYVLLQVQQYVHDDVLNAVIEVRGEEIQRASPPIPICDLQAAYETVKAMIRPQLWEFEPTWTPHQILHVLPSASIRVVRSAYKVIAKSVHPDAKNFDEKVATAMMQTVNTAWEKFRLSNKTMD